MTFFFFFLSCHRFAYNEWHTCEFSNCFFPWTIPNSLFRFFTLANTIFLAIHSTVFPRRTSRMERDLFEQCKAKKKKEKVFSYSLFCCFILFLVIDCSTITEKFSQIFVKFSNIPFLLLFSRNVTDSHQSCRDIYHVYDSFNLYVVIEVD